MRKTDKRKLMISIRLCAICGKPASAQFLIEDECAERYCRKHGEQLQDFLREKPGWGIDV